MGKTKYITKVDYIDSSIDFELGDNSLQFSLRMEAEYYKVEGEKETRLFSIKFWTDWHHWSIPPYDEDELTEDDIIDWFNENSLADDIVKDEYPELWDIDFYNSDVPTLLEADEDPTDDIESAIEQIWDGEKYKLCIDSSWYRESKNK